MFNVVNFAIRYPLAVVFSYLVSPARKFGESPKVGTQGRPGSLFDMGLDPGHRDHNEGERPIGRATEDL
jgi:hypothetical protein